MSLALRLAAVLLLVVGAPIDAMAQATDVALPLTIPDAGEQAGESLSLSLQILITMTLLTLLPALLLSMSAFVRLIIVLSILRQALGTAQTPPNQVLLGISLFLTFFIMAPVVNAVNEQAVQPYTEGTIGMSDAVKIGMQPIRQFMLDQTRDADLKLFANIAGHSGFDSVDDVPINVIIPAFMVSELKTAFQIGFLIFIPFLIIDLVVSSVLMSMGMMMLSPMLISLPFKLMLFVLVDGWALLLGTLASSFYV
ncbi:MAG: flagellar type III secretion system pore protein FliP [Pseudomonadota bacterium]